VTPTEYLAEFIYSFKLDAVNEMIIDKTKESIIDTLGAGIGASTDKEVDDIYKTFKIYDKTNSSTVWGKSSKMSIFTAVLLNAIMSHTLELDDVHKKSKCHAGTVVVPTALTIGEYLGTSGKEILEAIIVGYETMVRIGMGFGVSSHRLKGWHVTSTAGTFGAAATASKLFRLDKQQIVSALGLAGTQSSGVWAFTSDGATNKKFHPGHAAVCGVTSALLAQSGMTGSAHILDAADGGLFPAMSAEYNYPIILQELGKKYSFVELDRKPYACCRSMHPAINAVLNIMNRTSLNVDEIECINIKTYKIAIAQCGFTNEPKNVAEAKFSMAYGVAVALIDGKALTEEFSDERIKDTKIITLAKKVKLVEDKVFTGMYPEKWGCKVEIITRNGKKYLERVENAKGDPLNPLSQEEIKEKFMGLCVPVLGKQVSDCLYGRLLDIKNINTISVVTNMLNKEE